MLCNVMLCYVMLCNVMSCYVMLCNVMSCITSRTYAGIYICLMFVHFRGLSLEKRLCDSEV